MTEDCTATKQLMQLMGVGANDQSRRRQYLRITERLIATRSAIEAGAPGLGMQTP